MLCEVCKNKTATVHLTEIVDGQRTESHLCQGCAQKEGITVKNQLSLNELLGSLLAAGQQTDEQGRQAAQKSCPVCGMTMEKFGKQALLGCPKDYEVFENALMPIIEKAQDGRLSHEGKKPPLFTPQKIADDEIQTTKAKEENQAGLTSSPQVEKIKKQLAQAVRDEDYELAARLRDQLKELQ